MATTMEQRAKFRELRTSGISREEAQTQAYGNITPVVPTAPAPDVNSDANRLARLQASGGSPTAIANLQKTTAPDPVVPTAEVTGLDGQKFTQAPVDPNTGLSTPQKSIPVAPSQTEQDINKQYGGTIQDNGINSVQPKVENTPVKTEPTVDYTQAQGREQDIMTNLEKFKTQNMTPEQIKNASGYAQATPEKKAIIDGFLNPAKQDSGTIFNTLKMGGSVPASNTPEYRQAQARYNTFRKYTTYDVASLSTAMQGGDLLMGTQAYTDLTSDPQMLAKLQRARAFTNGEVDIVKTGEKMGAYVMSNNPTVAQALADGTMSQEEYNSLTNNAEVETQAKVVSEKKADYDEYKRQLENISDEVDLEFEGKEVTDSFKSTIKANRDKAIRRLFNSASDEYQNASGLYTELKNSSTQLLALNMEQYKTQQAEQQKIAQEERQMQNQLNLGQAQFDQKLAQQTQMMNDPATAIQSVMSEFAGMGITSQQSLQTKIADAQKFVANGGTLAGYVDKMRQDYMAKPQYNAMQQAEMNKYAPKATEYGFSNIGDGKIAITNPKTGTVSFANAGSVSSTNAPNTASAKYLDIPTGTDVGVQCGQFARTLCGMDATPGGNSLEARKTAYSDKAPVAGGMVLFTGNGYDKTYGHIAAIESVNQDGTMNIVESNLKNDNKVTRRTIPANDPVIHGFYNNTPLAKQGTQGTGTQGTRQYSDSDIALLGSVTKLDKQGKSTLSENGFTERDWANFNAGLLPPTSGQKTDANVIVSKVDDILSGDWSDAVGTFLGKSRIFTGGGTDRKVTELKVAALKDLLAMANLDKIKGAMSDKDIEFLRNTATYLSTDLSEAEFEKTLGEIKTKYSKISGGTPTNQKQPVQPQGNTNTGVGQTNQASGKQTYTW